MYRLAPTTRKLRVRVRTDRRVIPLLADHGHLLAPSGSILSRCCCTSEHLGSFTLLPVTAEFFSSSSFHHAAVASPLTARRHTTTRPLTHLSFSFSSSFLYIPLSYLLLSSYVRQIEPTFRCASPNHAVFPDFSAIEFLLLRRATVFRVPHKMRSEPRNRVQNSFVSTSCAIPLLLLLWSPCERKLAQALQDREQRRGAMFLEAPVLPVSLRTTFRPLPLIFFLFLYLNSTCLLAQSVFNVFAINITFFFFSFRSSTVLCHTIS